MKYGIHFLVHALACGVAALAAWQVVGWFALLFVYGGLSVLLLAAGAGPRLLLKRASGQHSVWAWVLFGPYFVVSALYFSVYRQLSAEPAFVQFTPNLFFGRWLSPDECVGRPWVSVLDLAAEFAEARPLRELTGYRSLPLLNVVTEAQLRSAVVWMTESAAIGPVYIHCAFGHNRSACAVIAYWLSIGEVRTVAEGERRLQSLRPGVRLVPSYRAALQAIEPRSLSFPNKSPELQTIAQSIARNGN